MSREHGGTFVEAALVSMTLVVFVLFVIDSARYFLVYAVLSYGAYQGLAQASKDEVETVTTTTACAGLLSANCDAYLTRVEAVIDTAVTTARQVATASSQNGFVKLVQFTHYRPADYTGSGLSRTIVRDAAFLRPGEVVVRADGTTLEHSLRPHGDLAGQGWPKSGESWATVLDSKPIEIVIEADFKTVTPGFGPFRIRVTQVKMRPVASSGVRLPSI